MSMYQQFQADEGLERDGVYLNYGDFRVRVRRAGGSNRKYPTGLEAMMRPPRRQLQAGTLGDEVADDIMRRSYAKWVVAGWEVKQGDSWISGIEGPNGDVLPVNEENLVQAFAALPDLFRDIVEQAGQLAIFRAEVREEDSGN